MAINVTGEKVATAGAEGVSVTVATAPAGVQAVVQVGTDPAPRLR